MTTAAYVYCLVQSARKPSLTRCPRGLPGAEAPQVSDAGGDFRVVHALVPLDRYGPGPLEASLKDLDWVSRVALAHEGVVEHFASLAGTTVIPMKLFTMFSSVDRALDEMLGHRRQLLGVFARLQGCEEWGVRVLRGERTKAAKSQARPETGAAFLAARKKARDDSRQALVAAATAADDAYAALSGLAAEHRRRTGESPGVTPPLLDAAFLVPVRRRARFKSAAQRIAGDVSAAGAEMTLTGPWPPYNFVNLPEETT